MKINKKKIATIVKSEDAENRVMRIDLEEKALLVEYLSSWSEMKDLKASVSKSAGMIIDYYRDSSEELGGLILKCVGENLNLQVSCLLSQKDIERWLEYNFSIDELIARIQ